MNRSRTARVGGWALAALLVTSIGCGGAAAPATESAPSAEPSAGQTASGLEPRAAFVVGAIEWLLFQQVRIDAAGVVFQGSRRVGTLTSEGTLLDRHGEFAARIDEAGWIVLEDRRTNIRIVGDAVFEVRDRDDPSNEDTGPVMRIEGTELVVGSGEEEERQELVGFRPELAREVLFVSAVIVVEMARGGGH